jgi:Holliday junction resolvase RusA-like endonuclease
MNDNVLIEARAGGRPRTKGSLRVSCLKNRAHTVRVEEEVEDSKRWRSRMALQLRHAQIEKYGKLISWPGPVEVRLVFFFPRDTSVKGGWIDSHATEWPTAITLGDVDKLTRNALDSMLTPRKRQEMPYCSALLADDSQVVSLSVGKFWTAADNEPGVQILVMQAGTPEYSLNEERAIWDGLKGAFRS